MVSDDGFIFSAAWSVLIGAGSPAVFRAVWSRSLGRRFINPCPVFPAVLVRDRFKVSGNDPHKIGCMVLVKSCHVFRLGLGPGLRLQLLRHYSGAIPHIVFLTNFCIND